MRIAMKTSITAMACLVIFGLSACATQKDPIWLDAGKVRMTGYTDKNILVFPVEVSPSYRLEPEEERVIQEQILNIMRDVFSLSNLNAPGKIKRFESYPFTQNEVTKLLKLYRADAAVVISVFNFQRSGHYNPETLGIRLAFVDASDPEKAWATSREYVSETGDQIGSAGLKLRITTDLRAVESALR